MNWREFLFSFQGRVGRKGYWLMAALSVPFFAASWAINGFNGDATDFPGLLVLLPFLWPALAVQIKRFGPDPLGPSA
jgi:uncharacterized membrane protein YhaH (DUF805 family)